MPLSLRHIIFTVLLLHACISDAQRPLPLMRHFTTQDGLISDIVYNVFQDSKGFIWFSTDQGINRFDGHQFVSFTTKDGLPDNEIFKLKEDQMHRVWLICYNRMPCYILNNKVYNTTNDSLCRKMRQSDITCNELFSDKNNNFYTVRSSLFRIDKANITPICPNVTFSTKFHYFEHEGQKYYADEYGIYKIENCIKKPLINIRTTYVLYNNFDHNLYASWYTTDSQLQHIIKLQISGDKVSIVNRRLFPGKIMNLFLYNDTTLWLCSDKGIIPYNTRTYNIDTMNTMLKGLPIFSALKDNESNFWFGTGTNGVYLLPTHPSYIYNKAAGLIDDNVTTVWHTSSQKLIAGFNGSSVNIITRDKIRSFSTSKTLMYNTVTNIQETNNDHEVLIGTDNGLFMLNTKTETCQLAWRSPTKDIKRIGNKYLVASTGSVILYDPTTKSRMQYSNIPATAIAQDRNDTIYIGTLEGILRYINGTIKKFQADSLLEQSRITDINITKNNYIIISTHKNGLFVWGNNKMQHIDDTWDLSSNICKKMILDSHDNIWVCTGNGLDKITHNDDFSNYKIIHFTQFDGVRTNNINDIHIANDTLYLATTTGLVIQDMRSTINTSPIRAYITSVQTRDSTWYQATNLTLNKSQNTIQINYTGISFTGENNISYKYVLTGFFNDTASTTSSFVNFNITQPGNYKFMVWARKGDGAWSTTPAVFTFTKKAAFWQSYWFISLAIVSIGGSIYFIFKRRIKIIQAKEKEKTASQKRMMEHEMYALREQINPHFLFNALNSIQHYYSQNDERTANRYLTSFAMLIRSTLSHSKTHWLDLTTELEMLQKYIDLEQMRLKHSFRYEIIMDPTIDPNSIKVPAMLMQPYIENAINHGLRHLQDRDGILCLIFSIEDNSLICSIDDNGIGFKAATAIKSNSHRHKSMGMDITHKRIETINQLYNTNIHVHITHKQEKNDLPYGTCVKLYFPLQIDTDHE